jgi:F-type H+-transporting ATPase subunit a
MEISPAPRILGYIAGFPVTDTFWVAIAISILLILVFTITAKRMKQVPKGLQFWVETIVVGSYDFMHDMTQKKQLTSRLHPFALTVFLIFIVGNLLTFVPGITSLTYNGHHLYRAATTDYNMVLIITMFFLIVIQATTIMTGGPLTYFKKFFNFTSPMNFVLGLFDLIGEAARLVSLSFRFFGNAFAGEVLIAVFLFIFPYLLPLPFMFLILLTSIIHPAVFALLATIYIQMAVVEKGKMGAR